MVKSANFNNILKNLNILYIEDEENIRINIKKFYSYYVKMYLMYLA